MRPSSNTFALVALASLGLVPLAFGETPPIPGAPAVTAPPTSFCESVGRRPAAPDEDEQPVDSATCRSFYERHLNAGGLPIVAAGEVSPLALQRAWWIVTHMLAGRRDILAAMVSHGTRLVVIGRRQVYTDLPEYREIQDAAFWNERVRGTGGFGVTSFGEENLLSLPLDRYDDESIAVHEFAHTMDAALGRIDPTWPKRLSTLYSKAMANGLFAGTYAATDPSEYWAEMVQDYFDCNRINNWNHGPVGRREQLAVYDPEGYAFVRSTLRLGPHQDWRYVWMKPLPTVTVPPPEMKIDPYYSKLTSARGFIIGGRHASDEALLRANDTVRKMFAYRHDILKSLMAHGLRLVVLAGDERVSDLPEYRAMPRPGSVDALSRCVDFSPELNLIVVSEANVLSDPALAFVGDSEIIRGLAKALHSICGMRPVDEAFEARPARLWQQYEKNVKRLDVGFDARLTALFDRAMAERRWQGTSAVHDRARYWAKGVLAYFDAAGQDAAPPDGLGPIRTREQLERYDAGLFDLVRETMAYEKKVDWRYRPVTR